MPPKQVAVAKQPTGTSMDAFVYNPATAHADWPRWYRRFEIFLLVQGTNKTTTEGKVEALNLLLHAGGDKIFDIYYANENIDTPYTFDTLKKDLDAHFSQKNAMVSRVQFRACQQGESESLLDYVGRLRVLANAAGIATDAANDEILSVISTNTRSHDLRMKCLDTGAELDKVIDWSKAIALKDQCASAIEQRMPNNYNVNKINSPHSSSLGNRTKCPNCGYGHDRSKECPAKGKTCNKCGKLNHFGQVCRSVNARMPHQQRSKPAQQPNARTQPNSTLKNRQSVHNITDNRQELFESFNEWYEMSRNKMSSTQASFQQDDASDESIAAIQSSAQGFKLSCPRMHISINGKRIRHLIDTGTNLNIVSIATFESIHPRPRLFETNTRAFAFNASTQLPIIGAFKAKVSHHSISSDATYLVLNGNAESILGFDTSTKLDLVSINDFGDICSIFDIKNERLPLKPTNTWVDPRLSHPTLFTGLPGRLNFMEVNLETDPSFKPVQQPSYPVPYHLQELTLKKLNFLEDQGIIRKHNSNDRITWVSPMHPVPKLDGQKNVLDVRITVNNKQLNKAIVKFKRHIPSLPELQIELNGTKVFSKLDFNDAFNQLQLNVKSQNLTAMATQWGIYIWNRLNMGLSTASEIFQETMQQLLGDIPVVKAVMDDVLIATADLESGQKSLVECLDRIKNAGLSLNIKKCEFLKHEVNFFGLTISANGIKLKKDKISDLMQATPPRNAKELHSFLGLTGYFKSRTPRQSEIEVPLRKLLKSKRKFAALSEEEAKAFQQLKDEVIVDWLAHFDCRKDTELHVDAGPEGCSSFLVQIQKDGSKKLIRCDSHSFSDAERNYSHVEKEAYACVWSIKTNHIYVFGRPFTCYTDALAVQKIFEEDRVRKRTPTRFIRWKSELSHYNVTFKHRSGHDNIADFLSRNFKRATPSPEHTSNLEHTINQIVASQIPTSISMAELIEHSKEDRNIQLIKSSLKYPRAPKELSEYKNIWLELNVSKEGILLRNDLIVIPESLHKKVIEAAHEGHQGITTTKRLLRSICWFPKMTSHIEKVIKDCWPCEVNTDNTRHEPLQPTKMTSDIWHTIAVDFGSETPTGEYILNIKDENTRRLILKYTSNLTSDAAIRACKEVFQNEGVPEIVKTDNVPAFRSAKWSEFARDYKFKHRKLTPLHPAANGGIERTMRLNNKTIRIANTTKQSWKQLMSKSLQRYNETPHSATKVAPDTLSNKQKPSDILPIINQTQKRTDMMQLAILNDEKYKRSMKEYADAKHRAKQHQLKVNDPVLDKWVRTSKFTPLFDPNPYRVISINRSMVTASNERRTLTRNSSHFKHITEKCYEQAQASKITIPRKSVQFQHKPQAQQEDVLPMTPTSPTRTQRTIMQRLNTSPVITSAVSPTNENQNQKRSARQHAVVNYKDTRTYKKAS